MKAYSQDIREKIVKAVDEKKRTQEETSEIFGVSISFVEKLLIRRRRTGKIEALGHGGGQERKLKGEEKVIEEEVRKQADITLEELCKRVEERTGKKAVISTMCKELKRMGLKRKNRVNMQKNKKVKR